MRENLHELSYLTDVEWKTIYFFYRVVYTDRWIGEGRHDLLTGDQLVFMMQGNPAGSAMAALWGAAIFSAAGENAPYVLVYQLDHIPLWGGSWRWGFVWERA